MRRRCGRKGDCLENNLNRDSKFSQQKQNTKRNQKGFLFLSFFGKENMGVLFSILSLSFFLSFQILILFSFLFQSKYFFPNYPTKQTKNTTPKHKKEEKSVQTILTTLGGRGKGKERKKRKKKRPGK